MCQKEVFFSFFFGTIKIVQRHCGVSVLCFNSTKLSSPGAKARKLFVLSYCLGFLLVKRSFNL